MTNTIKEEIKSLSEQQIFLKDQRKTVYNTKSHTVQPWVASDTHSRNRYLLRHLFMAYSILRGKDPIPPKHKEWSQSKVDKLVEKYTVKVA